MNKLEGYLGKQIIRLNPSRNFQHHLKIYGYWLPSAKQRWCTDKLKIKPLEKWIKPDLDKGVKITSYVAIRFDEKYREGHQSRHKNYTVKLPFMDDKIDRKGVYDLLDNTGLEVLNTTNGEVDLDVLFVFFKENRVGKIKRKDLKP